MLHLVDGEWYQTLVQGNILSFGEKLFPCKVKVTHHGGYFSQHIVYC